MESSQQEMGIASVETKSASAQQSLEDLIDKLLTVKINQLTQERTSTSRSRQRYADHDPESSMIESPLYVSIISPLGTMPENVNNLVCMQETPGAAFEGRKCRL